MESAQTKSKGVIKTLPKTLKHSKTKKKQGEFSKTSTSTSCSTLHIVVPSSVTPNHFTRDESRQRGAKKSFKSRTVDKKTYPHNRPKKREVLTRWMNSILNRT